MIGSIVVKFDLLFFEIFQILLLVSGDAWDEWWWDRSPNYPKSGSKSYVLIISGQDGVMLFGIFTFSFTNKWENV